MHAFKTTIVGLVFLMMASPAGVDAAWSQAFDEESISTQRVLVQKVNQTVVQVIVDEFGRPSRFQKSGSVVLNRNVSNGSGVFVSSDGYIITNQHVIDEAETVQVLLPQPRADDLSNESILSQSGQILVAEVVGSDRETDIAVLKVDVDAHPHLSFGDSESLHAGDFVFAFGSPLGLEKSVSMGIVSAKARQFRQDDPMIYIQTDATINPGNSGGPLVNMSGEIVGINTLNLSQSGGSEGLGFAAPSNIVETVYSQIRENGYVRRGVIGIRPQTITPRLAEALGVGLNRRVILGDVLPGSPADLAGLSEGDIVIKLDDKIIENARQLDVNIYGKEIGSTIEIDAVRDGEIRTFTVQVEERQDPENKFRDLVDMEENFIAKIGVLAIGLTTEIREMLPPLRKRGGILVAASNGKSAVMGDALRPGDIIYSVNGDDMFSYDEFYSAFDQFGTGDYIVMHIQRGSELMYVSHRLLD
ncbi:MAG: PDZ domain-containing protein [Bacteroidetes bacterium]|jgi:serine protease Do|nr:PDZ domain-containing protein [Bacteroidota bacterium]